LYVSLLEELLTELEETFLLLELLLPLLLEDLPEELEDGLDELLDVAAFVHLAQNSLSPLSVLEILVTAFPSNSELSNHPSKV
jgi:hypothetical protein